jgi:hypothetical protein
MGFRDLVVFNRALLAKQGWRLISKLDSLVAKIMQQKYYPRGAFFRLKWDADPLLLGAVLFRRELF